MTTPYKGNYGYGFVVSEESNAVSHTGKIDKYNAALVFTKNLYSTFKLFKQQSD